MFIKIPKLTPVIIPELQTHTVQVQPINSFTKLVYTTKLAATDIATQIILVLKIMRKDASEMPFIGLTHAEISKICLSNVSTIRHVKIMLA